MNKVAKCIKLAMLAFFVTFVFIMCGKSHATYIPTPEKYEKHLEEQGDPDSLQLREQFLKLPREKKQKLLGYFFDPEVMKSIYSQDTPCEGRQVLYNGDVVIENKTTLTEKDVEEGLSQPTRSYLPTFLFGKVFAPPKIKEYTARHVRQINVGVAWIKFHTSITYRVKNGKVTKVSVGNSEVSKFLWLWTIEKKAFKKYITVSNNVAHGTAIWGAAVPVLKNKIFNMSRVQMLCYHQVHGYSNGKIAHGYWGAT